MLDRRAFLTGALSLLATPVADAQQAGRVYHIGAILQGGPYYAAVDGLRDGLKEFGLEQRKHYVIDVRDTKGDLRLVEAAVRRLEEQKVDVIYTVGTWSAPPSPWLPSARRRTPRSCSTLEQIRWPSV